MEETRKGKTTVAPDVLLTIARMSTLGVEGVNRMAPVPGGVNRLFKRGAGDGVQITVEDNFVYADLYVVMNQDVNIREVSRNVQQQVARAIQEMVAMDIGHINIHIEGIDYSVTPGEAQPA
ncbi:MAG: Asp23/Gls24 family envelope stress response protein [Chloroflexota bacterium]